MSGLSVLTRTRRPKLPSVLSMESRYTDVLNHCWSNLQTNRNRVNRPLLPQLPALLSHLCRDVLEGVTASLVRVDQSVTQLQTSVTIPSPRSWLQPLLRRHYHSSLVLQWQPQWGFQATHKPGVYSSTIFPRPQKIASSTSCSVHSVPYQV